MTEISSSSREQPSQGPVVLLVDDDSTTRLAMTTRLREAQYVVLEASSVDEANVGGRKTSPAVAIVSLPHRSGLDACTKLNAISHIPIVFLSTSFDASWVNEALIAGVFVYLVKPIEPVHLLPVVQAALHRVSALKSQTLVRQTDQRLYEEQQRNVNVVTGLLMERLHISHNDAYNRLRQYARSRQTKIIDVARVFLDAAESNHKFIAEIAAASDVAGISGSRPAKS